MKFYHFTGHWNLPGILREGLRAKVQATELLTARLAVVWLTASPTMDCGPNDAAWLESSEWSAEKKAEFREWGIITGRDTRLTLELHSPQKRLHHWATWVDHIAAVAADGKVTHLRDCVDVKRGPPSAIRDWWIYLGDIPSRRIVDIETTQDGLDACANDAGLRPSTPDDSERRETLPVRLA
jgi:hypothetical protein